MEVERINLAKCAVAGDKDAFTVLVQGMRKRLYVAAYAILCNEADALDAIDETVYRAYVSVRKLRKPEFFDTWITRILINAAKDILRTRKHFIEGYAVPERVQEVFDALPLKEALKNLSEGQRRTIQLRFLAGYSIEETARILKKPTGTISTWQRRALMKLKLELEDDPKKQESDTSTMVEGGSHETN